jgi:hypothetical protein
MSDRIEQNLWHRIRYTPLSDALRGRVTGRLDVTGRVNASSLPQALKDFVLGVARRTRLWRIERLAVADELLAHFEDGLSARETPEALIERFGDPSAAAKLIRRSMRRKRSIFWKAMNVLRWLCVAMITFYALSAVYFFMGRPYVRVDYIARMNRQATAAPQDQRAWPLYRKLIPQLQLDEKQPSFEGPNGPVDLFDIKPGEPHWNDLVQWLKEHSAALDLAREAAGKPAMGFVFGPGGSAYDTDVWPRRQPAEPEAHPLMLAVLLPHLNGLRSLANILAADVRLACEEGDGARVVRNVDAMCGIADQLIPDSLLVQQFVAIGIRNIAVQELAKVIGRKPSLLTPAQLAHVAHRFARPASAAAMFDMATERTLFYDVVQHAYTDDGHGDGRLTPQGARMIDWLGQPSLGSGVPLSTVLMASPPALLASRSEVVTLYDRWMDLSEANLRRPARDQHPTPFLDEFSAIKRSPVQSLRYALLTFLVPSLDRLPTIADRYLGQRDGLLIGIALELHRREPGRSYPASLDELVPSLLPSAPVDRITGGALHYRIVDGKPLVYSVGADLDDDGGVAPRDQNGRSDPLRAAEWNRSPSAHREDGDWVLFPPATE